MILETKGSILELKDISPSKREVAFYFSSFGNVDNHKHIVQKGAFKKTATENIGRVRHFKNHNDSENFGKIISIEEDEKGAFAVSRIKRGANGDQMITDYEDEIIKEHSFGAYPVKQTKTADGIIIKQEYKLMEVSSLDNWGANASTPLISIKSLTGMFRDVDLFAEHIKDMDLSSQEKAELKSKLSDILGYVHSSDTKPSNDTLEKKMEIEQAISQIKNFKFI
jgi:HK97 family phage prohead protease